MITKSDIKNIVNEIVIDTSHAILNGVEILLKGYATKDDLRQLASKKDLEKLATKEDLKREISWVRDDIKGLEGELSNTVSLDKFNKLKSRVDEYHPFL